MKKDKFTLDKQLALQILKDKLKDQKAAEQICELFERASRSEKAERCLRQKEGIQRARESGVALGRPRLEVPDNFVQLLEEWKKGELRAATAAKACGIGVSTFYRRARMYLNERKVDYQR